MHFHQSVSELPNPNMTTKMFGIALIFSWTLLTTSALTIGPKPQRQHYEVQAYDHLKHYADLSENHIEYIKPSIPIASFTIQSTVPYPSLSMNHHSPIENSPTNSTPPMQFVEHSAINKTHQNLIPMFNMIQTVNSGDNLAVQDFNGVPMKPTRKSKQQEDQLNESFNLFVPRRYTNSLAGVQDLDNMEPQQQQKMASHEIINFNSTSVQQQQRQSQHPLHQSNEQIPKPPAQNQQHYSKVTPPQKQHSTHMAHSTSAFFEPNIQEPAQQLDYQHSLGQYASEQKLFKFPLQSYNRIERENDRPASEQAFGTCSGDNVAKMPFLNRNLSTQSQYEHFDNVRQRNDKSFMENHQQSKKYEQPKDQYVKESNIDTKYAANGGYIY